MFKEICMKMLKLMDYVITNNNKNHILVYLVLLFSLHSKIKQSVTFCHLVCSMTCHCNLLGLKLECDSHLIENLLKNEI